MISEPDFEKCLSSWGLKKDPFIENYRSDLWARPDKDIQRLHYYLSNSIKQRSLLNILLKGDYGSGKTYTLKYLKNYVEGDLRGIGIYFLIPRKYSAHGFRDILTEFIRSITINKLEQIGKIIGTENQINTYDNLKDFLIKLPLDPDLAKAISNLVYDNDYAMTSAWLYGKSTVNQDRALGMEFSTRDESTIISIISDIIFLLSTKNPIVAILIDEIENLTGESISIRSIREGFRNLYDQLLEAKNHSSVVIISAVTARAVYEIQSSMGTAMLDRVNYDISLNPLSEEECKNFLQKLFEDSQATKNPTLIPPFADDSAINLFIKKFPKTKVLPYTSIGEIRTPRRLVKVGSFLLNEACMDRIELINSEFIEKTII